MDATNATYRKEPLLPLSEKSRGYNVEGDRCHRREARAKKMKKGSTVLSQSSTTRNETNRIKSKRVYQNRIGTEPEPNRDPTGTELRNRTVSNCGTEPGPNRNTRQKQKKHEQQGTATIPPTPQTPSPVHPPRHTTSIGNQRETPRDTPRGGEGGV